MRWKTMGLLMAVLAAFMSAYHTSHFGNNWTAITPQELGCDICVLTLSILGVAISFKKN